MKITSSCHHCCCYRVKLLTHPSGRHAADSCLLLNEALLNSENVIMVILTVMKAAFDTVIRPLVPLIQLLFAPLRVLPSQTGGADVVHVLTAQTYMSISSPNVLSVLVLPCRWNPDVTLSNPWVLINCNQWLCVYIQCAFIINLIQHGRLSSSRYVRLKKVLFQNGYMWLHRYKYGRNCHLHFSVNPSL